MAPSRKDSSRCQVRSASGGNSSASARRREANNNNNNNNNNGAIGTMRRWTNFELDTVLALVCKGDHLQGHMILATKLNEALNGTHGNFHRDIPVAEVKKLLAYLETEKKYALYFIGRQGGPRRITRKKKLVFARDLPFDGTMKEWVVDGRREAVMRKRESAADNTGNGPRGAAQQDEGVLAGRVDQVHEDFVARGLSLHHHHHHNDRDEDGDHGAEPRKQQPQLRLQGPEKVGTGGLYAASPLEQLAAAAVARMRDYAPQAHATPDSALPLSTVAVQEVDDALLGRSGASDENGVRNGDGEEGGDPLFYNHNPKVNADCRGFEPFPEDAHHIGTTHHQESEAGVVGEIVASDISFYHYDPLKYPKDAYSVNAGTDYQQGDGANGYHIDLNDYHFQGANNGGIINNQNVDNDYYNIGNGYQSINGQITENKNDGNQNIGNHYYYNNNQAVPITYQEYRPDYTNDAGGMESKELDHGYPSNPSGAAAWDTGYQHDHHPPFHQEEQCQPDHVGEPVFDDAYSDSAFNDGSVDAQAENYIFY